MSSQTSILLPGIYDSDGFRSRTLLAIIGSKCIYTDDDVTPLLTHLNADRPLKDSNHKGIAVQTCTVGGFRRVVGDNPNKTFTSMEAAYLASKIFPLRSLRRTNKFERNVFARVPESESNPPMPKPAIVLPIPAVQPAPDKPTRFSMMKRLGSKLRVLLRSPMSLTTVPHKATPA